MISDLNNLIFSFVQIININTCKNRRATAKYKGMKDINLSISALINSVILKADGSVLSV